MFLFFNLLFFIIRLIRSRKNRLKKVHEIIQNYKIDLIHCDFLFGLNSLRIFNVPISYNAHNIESEYARKIGFYSWKKIPKILRFLYIKFIYYLEKFGVKLASNINAISQEERRELIEIFGLNEDKVIVSGLGYKKDIYNKQISKTEARKNLKIPKNKFIIIFHGSYNVNFANKETIDLIKDYIAPRIKDDSILFLIAGSMPRFEDQRNVKFLGFIKELTDFLYCADIAIAPILRGTGINTKMIDYLSGRVPIISTEKAVEGLIFQHEVHGFIVSNIMTDTIKYIYYLKGNPKILQVIKNNITNLVESKYNWGKILKKVEKRYLRLSEI
ncbi:MAG: glycosyltransferase [Candidatus Lokiarchaeota archaeon]